MALRMNIRLDQVDLTVSGAYVRVEKAVCTRASANMDCTAHCYEQDPSQLPTLTPFKAMFFSVPYSPAGGDVYGQAYAGAKALPEFAGAADA